MPGRNSTFTYVLSLIGFGPGDLVISHWIARSSLGSMFM